MLFFIISSIMKMSHITLITQNYGNVNMKLLIAIKIHVLTAQ